MTLRMNRSSGRSLWQMWQSAALGLAILASLFVLAGCNQPSLPSATSLLAAAAQHFNDAKTFHFVMTSDHLGPKQTGSPTLSDLSAADGDVQRPDRLSANGTVDLGGITVSTKLIIVGQRAWFLNPLTGNFDEEDDYAGFVGIFDPAKGLGIAITSLRNLSLPSDGSSNGTPCWKISGDVDTATLGSLLGEAANPAKPPRATICIGKTDGRLYSVVITGQLVTGDLDNTTRTFVLSKYDAPVNIQPPA